MRLVDADKIIITLLSRTYIGDGDYYNGREIERDNIIDIINEAETIDIMEQGMWVPDKFGSVFCCSECGHGITNTEKYFYLFCPICGARMDG